MVSGMVTTLALTLPYYFFEYPMLGSVWSVVAVIVPYILACTMLGIALSTLFCHREEPIMWLLWSSIPILMLSGVSYPTSAMPEPLAADSMEELADFAKSIDGHFAVETGPEKAVLLKKQVLMTKEKLNY